MNPVRAAIREASLGLPWYVPAGLFLLPLFVVPYLSGLAVDTMGRIASDAAYFFSVFATQGIAILAGLLAVLPEDGWTHVQVARGRDRGRIQLERAAGFFVALLLPLACALGGAYRAALDGGAPDASRILLPAASALPTFGLMLLFGSVLPRAGAALLGGAFVAVAHILSAGRTFDTAWFHIVLPPYAFFDAWPGTEISSREILQSTSWGALYGFLAVMAAAFLRRARRT